MSSNPAPKKGKGGKRKIGRMARKPSHSRYNMEARWEKTKNDALPKKPNEPPKKLRKKLREKTLSNIVPEHSKSWNDPLNGLSVTRKRCSGIFHPGDVAKSGPRQGIANPSLHRFKSCRRLHSQKGNQ